MTIPQLCSVARWHLLVLPSWLWHAALLQLTFVHQADTVRPDQLWLKAMMKGRTDGSQKLRQTIPQVFQDLHGEPFHRGMAVAGLLIEGRCSPTLELVINNFMQQLPGIPLYFFHARSNEAFAHSITSNLDDNVHLLALPEPWYSTLDWDSYSSLLTNRGLWQGLTASGVDRVLLVAGDSWLCEGALDKLPKFMRYHWVGAPWWDGECCNGGLSLRSPQSMVRILETSSPWSGGPEDRYFVGNLKRLQQEGIENEGSNLIQMPEKPEEAATFALEYVVEGKEAAMFQHIQPFGVHKPWGHFGSSHGGLDAHLEQLETHCPGLSKMVELQLKDDRARSQEGARFECKE